MTDDAATLLDAARARLAAADAPRERLGEVVRPRVLAGLRSPKIVPRGDAWRLGVLLIGESAVYGAGNVVRAGDPGRRGFASDAARARADVAAAATRGGFGDGETVHLDWKVLDLAALGRGETAGPLALVDGTPSVRWSPAAAHVPLAGYLDERIALLLQPPPGT
ncbi:glutaminase [Microbacterium sp.]|uniref:glutaminase n=1 Tax=Microbacterium sp. TaxID=51671 RepID=UPI0037C8A0DE